MEIRQTRMDELDKVMDIYARARRFMAEHENPTQWGQTRPSREEVLSDIQRSNSYVCIEGDEIVAVFYFAKEADPTYANIYDGSWLNDEEYAVVHRIAAAGTIKGAGSYCMDWACAQADNVRIDTHADNYVMQNMLRKTGFVHCGTIYLENGEPRMAFHKRRDNND